MCTVSVVPLIGGCRLMCNRDERLTRAQALPPAIQRLGCRTAIFPVDPDGGGTWVGANDVGLAAALLNRTDAVAGAEGGSAGRWDRGDALETRGAIVPAVLGAGSLEAAVAIARSLPRHRYLPFRLLLVHGREAAVVVAGSRDYRDVRMPLDRPLMLASSSLGDARADGPRRALFARMMRGADVPSWLRAQRRFHAHAWTDRPDVSVTMARADARTVSRTTCDVRPHVVTMTYEPLGVDAKAVAA